jgi:hypothetical protein
MHCGSAGVPCLVAREEAFQSSNQSDRISSGRLALVATVVQGKTLSENPLRGQSFFHLAQQAPLTHARQIRVKATTYTFHLCTHHIAQQATMGKGQVHLAQLSPCKFAIAKWCKSTQGKSR